VEALECVVEMSQSFRSVHGILGEINKIEEGAHGADELRRRVSVGELDIYDETEKKPRDLVMFLAGDSRETRDPVHEKADVVVRRESATTSVNLGFTAAGRHPSD
jgi:hypothetical protein